MSQTSTSKAPESGRTTDAFIERIKLSGDTEGPLAGTSFVAKDNYDVADTITGGGNPDWRAGRAPAQQHAGLVARLLETGATLVGKTHTDELCYSLMGVNAHYGTPLNPAAPDRVPGGSSSGSASAVAAGEADIGLGSDTGGSIRLPAAFCGIWGLRPTHGTIDDSGMLPLAPSFDTPGWLARGADMLDRASDALGLAAAAAPVRLLLPVDAWARASMATVNALAPALAALERELGPARPIVLAPEGLGQWREVFRVCQAADIWNVHGDWISRVRPKFGPGVAERFAAAERIGAAEAEEARRRRADIRAQVRDLVDGGTAIVLPIAPGPPPRRDDDEGALDGYRAAALELLGVSGLSGLPQLSIPAGRVENAPVALGLIGEAGSERGLIALARATEI